MHDATLFFYEWGPCDHMGLTLSNMTGLALHSSVPKTTTNDEDDADEDSFDEEEVEFGQRLRRNLMNRGCLWLNWDETCQ